MGAVVEATEFPDGVQAFQSDVDIYDLVREGVSKARGIERYVSRQGDTLEQVIAFGDSGNDRRMLEEAGVSLAMKNGIKKSVISQIIRHPEPTMKMESKSS